MFGTGLNFLCNGIVENASGAVEGREINRRAIYHRVICSSRDKE